MKWLSSMKASIDYIEDNLMNEIDIEAIAKVALSSSYHYQITFNMITGYTVMEYVRKRRMTLAAFDILNSNEKIIDIAFKYLYESPEAFSRAFKKIHGVSPSIARKDHHKLKSFSKISFQITIKGDVELNYKIVDHEKFSVLGIKRAISLKNQENYTTLPKFWEEVMTDGSYKKLESFSTKDRCYGIATNFDNENESMDYYIAVDFDESKVNTSEFEVVNIPSKKWVVFTARGVLPKAIIDVWKRLFTEWFPESGYEIDMGPQLEYYLEGDSSQEDYECEVWIPIVKKAN